MIVHSQYKRNNYLVDSHWKDLLHVTVEVNTGP